jgi:hypothetical protein
MGSTLLPLSVAIDTSKVLRTGVRNTPMFCLATIQGARRIRDAGISGVVKELRRVDADV